MVARSFLSLFLPVRGPFASSKLPGNLTNRWRIWGVASLRRSVFIAMVEFRGSWPVVIHTIRWSNNIVSRIAMMEMNFVLPEPGNPWV